MEKKVLTRGRFITFEGPDGAGKTTNIRFMEKYLTEIGYTVIVTREPGGSILGEEIRGILLSGRVKTNKAELLLFAASRADHIEQVIKPALEAGKIVLCDRFSDSSYAYQGQARGMIREVEDLERWTLDGFDADHTLFFDLTLEESLKRLFGRTDNNAFDAFAREFKINVYRGYQKRFASNPHRMFRIDAMKPLIHVEGQIRAFINTILVPQLDGEAFVLNGTVQVKQTS